MLLQKLIKKLLKGLFLLSFGRKLIGIIVSDKSCLQPVLIQIILVSVVFLLDEAFEFTQFLIGLRTKFGVTNSLRLDAFILFIP